VCPQEAIEFSHLLEGAWSDVVTLNLIRCRVCGEALYTEAYAKTIEDHLKTDLQPLCARHQEEYERLAAAHFPSQEKASKKVMK
jgi:hypothetical protein